MKRSASWWIFATAFAAFGLARPALADIFSFKDEKGVMHFTNMPDDKRYKLVRREAGVAPTASQLAFGGPVYMPSAADIARYSAIIDTAARAHGVDSALVHAVISAESGYNKSAVSRTGARGLMQLMPATAERYGVQNIMDPTENIVAGVKYLRDLLQMFQGNLELTVAAYNAGENAVIRAGNRVPPYAETMGYVPKVLAFYHKFQQRHSS
ncbi:MAG TPA: transglycosylase SLT domain-containing protein [Usitatibacter sp.]|jgi:soluble lytic murein transglycosylase-like protein|nr:transglycosylase SLT domain-containing protein [Usitatibacter sp.]